MNAKEFQATGGVVTGMILVSNALATVLLDSGALHCFISIMSLSHNSIDFAILPTKWDIQTRNSNTTTNNECILCCLIINSKEFYTNSLVISREEYDVIIRHGLVYKKQPTEGECKDIRESQKTENCVGLVKLKINYKKLMIKKDKFYQVKT